LERPRRI